MRRTRLRQDDALDLVLYGEVVMSSAWIILVFAGFLEVCWAIGLKYTNGFTCIGPSVLVASQNFCLAVTG